MSAGPADLGLIQWFAEFADQGIFTTDARLIVTRWNKWLERHSGRPASDAVGRSLLDLYPSLVERGLDEHYREALEGHAHLVSHLLHGHLLPMRARVGEHLFPAMPQRARIAPLMDGDTVLGTVTVIDDVSERVASEQELRKQIEAQAIARAAAESALRAKDDFLATLSHEIRTPLTAVLGWTRILREHQLDPNLIARGIAVIDRNTILQMRMIDDLLDTARIMAGKLRLQMQQVDLVPVAIAALDVIDPAAAAKEIRISRHFDPNVAPVLGDPDRLQQVMWNLLSNALKFTDKGGRIEVRLEQDGTSVRFSVRDSGSGISPEFLPFIFDRFRQADASSSRRESGLGLGLALVKELVTLHGGEIAVHSEGTEKGTLFAITLPALPADEGAAVAAQVDRGERASPTLRGLHVLVVEDDPDARDLLVTTVAEADARVTAVSCATDALDIVAGSKGAGRPDVMVADMALPDFDGFELIRRLRARTTKEGGAIPAIAVSAYYGDEHRESAQSAGYLAYLTKPFDASELIGALRRAARAGF